MKYSCRYLLHNVFGLLITCAFLGTLFSQKVMAATPVSAPSQELTEAKRFKTADEAIHALKKAAIKDDHAALREIFGPEFRELLTGDKVLDDNNVIRFGNAMNQGSRPSQVGKDKITLKIGKDLWPMPIPLIQSDGQWYFDTHAGKEEIINRHIGANELFAIGICRAYVIAQMQYFSRSRNVNQSGIYAQKFKSTPGKKDGLYWPTSKNEFSSPFGTLVEEAYGEGYGTAQGEGPHSFHGYYFKILTQQGAAAPGGKIDYIRDGHLVRGFALIAYPVVWGKSGVMTFIVNQNEKVFQQNLGEKTGKMASTITEYNPDDHWVEVHDKGVSVVDLRK